MLDNKNILAELTDGELCFIISQKVFIVIIFYIIKC